MNCPSCGKENAEGNWVCGHCGEPLPAPRTPSPTYNRPSASAPAPAPGRTGGISNVTKIIALVIVAGLGAFLLWFFLIRGPDTSTPGGTMEAYFNAVNDQDCERIYEMTPGNDPKNRELEMAACSMFSGFFNFKYTGYKTLEETVDGDNASVRYTVTIEMGGMSASDEKTTQLLKEGGRWKVLPDANNSGSSI